MTTTPETKKKIQEPVKNLRPITLLEAMRKVLSSIFMNRTEDKININLAKRRVHTGKAKALQISYCHTDRSLPKHKYRT